MDGLDTEQIPEVLPGIALSSEQWAALQAIEAFLQSQSKLYLLTGYAGTGKTTLLHALISRLRQQGDSRSVVLSAFSNKATKVLRTMAAQWSLDVDCMTCCKLLGLKPVIDTATGDQLFETVNDQLNQVPHYRLVVVDECSMVNQEMWKLLVNAVSRLDIATQMLFVGDPAQLPPVNELQSCCFEQIIHSSALNQVIRYGGAIGVIADDIRRNIERSQLPTYRSDVSTDQTEGFFIMPRDRWQSLLIRAFTSAKYRDNPDQVRVLAYTNRRVKQLNQLIRTAIYGAQISDYVVGERLITNTPCLDEEAVLLQTSEECEVIGIKRGKVENLPVWLLEVCTEAGDCRDLVVLQQPALPDFQQRLDSYAKTLQWELFWAFRQRFHDVNYAYSLTVHKSQGSTFQDVFVDLPNLMRNPK
ncbi:MAG: AAA family ATPase, partial [Leptolyngbya sp. SIO4C1]|nr:AAA family ATPase [Leptolyngbya sp. SIO4C1]